MLRIITLCLLTLAMSAKATVDVNLPELEYISDHLTPDECRRLVAALHSRSYKLNSQFTDSVRKVPRDVSCLNMLVHWNSRSGEGRGQTHSILSRRLKQIDRRDLATWLSQTSFHQLAEDLGNTLLKEIRDEPEADEPIRQPRETNETCADSTDETPINETAGNETESKSGASFWNMLTDTTDENYVWNLMDLIGFVLLVFVSVAILAAIVWWLMAKGCSGQREDVEGCNCDHGSAGTSSPRHGGAPDSLEANKLPVAKRDKKKKKDQRSLKSMVCKTVEYRTDGTVEEVQLLLNEASETDFDRAVDIVAGKQAESDNLHQGLPPLPRNSKRNRMQDAGLRRTRDETSLDYGKKPLAIDGGSTTYEMQEMHSEGQRNGIRKASNERERGYDERSRTNDDNRGYYNEARRWSDDKKGDSLRDPCWDCNQ